MKQAELTDEEKHVVTMMNLPQVPKTVVEGEYGGERAVFICLVTEGDAPGKTDLTPLAMLLRDSDVAKVRATSAENKPLIHVPGDS